MSDRCWDSDERLDDADEALRMMCDAQLRLGHCIDSATFTTAIHWPSNIAHRSFVAGFEQVSYRGLYCLLGPGNVSEGFYMLGRSFRESYAADTAAWHGEHAPFPVADPYQDIAPYPPGFKVTATACCWLSAEKGGCS